MPQTKTTEIIKKADSLRNTKSELKSAIRLLEQTLSNKKALKPFDKTILLQ